VIVSVAGPVEHEQVVEMVAKALGRLPARNKATSRRAPRLKQVEEFIPRSSEQVHLLVGLPSCSYKSKHRFESFVVNDLLGGGVTSRFYQKVREDKGMAYSVYSFLQSFVDTGLFMTYVGTSAEHAKPVLTAIKNEMERFLRTGIKADELSMFKTQVKGQILLGAEDMENRMSSLGVNEMIFQKYRPVDEVIEDIEKVTLKSVRDYVKKYFDMDKASLMVMGDMEPKQALELMDLF
jgi:predicted Zn-dependent peptidase